MAYVLVAMQQTHCLRSDLWKHRLRPFPTFHIKRDVSVLQRVHRHFEVLGTSRMSSVSSNNGGLLLASRVASVIRSPGKATSAELQLLLHACRHWSLWVFIGEACNVKRHTTGAICFKASAASPVSRKRRRFASCSLCNPPSCCAQRDQVQEQSHLWGR